MPIISREEGREGVAEVGRLLRREGGVVHLVGAGGIGMAGLAVHLAARGCRVTGCDTALNRLTAWLADKGIWVVEGHSPSHVLNDVSWVVRSTAVPDSSPEIQAAAAKEIPVFPRGLVLPALLRGHISIAVSGTHGKTTTTNMIAQILHEARVRPGFCIGGEVDKLGGAADPGSGRYMVVEADESDGTVAFYEPDVAVVTNIEYDHMEHFENEETLVGCFRDFAANARQRIIYCADDRRAAECCAPLGGSLSYGFAETARVRGATLSEKADSIALDMWLGEELLGRVTLPVPGRHNALNALAACAAALEVGLTFEQIRSGLSRFVHARRRFERVCEAGGILVISDYAHHPTEIRALVRTARQLERARVIVVFQPHRYTRTRALGRDFPPAFDGADEVVLVPVYAASEEPLAGGTSKDLLAHFAQHGGAPVRLEESLEGAWSHVKPKLAEGDLLLVVGAGDVERLAFRARDELQAGPEAGTMRG